MSESLQSQGEYFLGVRWFLQAINLCKAHPYKITIVPSVMFIYYIAIFFAFMVCMVLAVVGFDISGYWQHILVLFGLSLLLCFPLLSTWLVGGVIGMEHHPEHSKNLHKLWSVARLWRVGIFGLVLVFLHCAVFLYIACFLSNDDLSYVESSTLWGYLRTFSITSSSAILTYPMHTYAWYYALSPVLKYTLVVFVPCVIGLPLFFTSQIAITGCIISDISIVDLICVAKLLITRFLAAIVVFIVLYFCAFIITCIIGMVLDRFVDVLSGSVFWIVAVIVSLVLKSVLFCAIFMIIYAGAYFAWHDVSAVLDSANLKNNRLLSQ